MSGQFITNVNEKNIILTRAKSAVISRDFTTAALLYKQLLRDEPSNVDYLKELGSIYVKNSEDAKAIPYYEQIITFYPHYVEAMNSLGGIFRRLKRYDDSIQILQRALDEGRQTSEVNYNLGFTYKEMGNFDDAIDAFESVIRENPSDVLAYNHMGTIYLEQKDYEKAIASYRKGLQVDPNHPILNYNLARCYTQAKMTNDAIRCYEKTLRVKPGWIEAIKEFSTILINSQKTKEASDLVQRAIQLHPKDAELLGMLGQIYLDQYDYDSAEKTFKKARSLNAKDVDVLKGLAQALEKEEKAKEALEAVNTALELEPENQDLIKQYISTLLSARDYDAAHDNVKTLFDEKGKQDPQVLDLYGQYYICTEQEDSAKEYFDEIEKNNKQYKDHLLSQATRYNQIGEAQKAVRKAEEYVSKVKDNADAYNTLGKLYQETGDLNAAMDSFNRSKSLVKPNVFADQNISSLQKMMSETKVVESEEPVVEEQIVENEPVVEEEVIDNTPEEFDFNSMGDNVPMGEALVEEEDDFFDDDDEQDLPEEIEEEEEEEPQTFGEYSNPYGQNMDSLEDENLSPFESPYEEPKSENQQLVPDADFSNENEEPLSDEQDLLDSMMNNPSNPFEKEQQIPQSSNDNDKNDDASTGYENPSLKEDKNQDFDKAFEDSLNDDENIFDSLGEPEPLFEKDPFEDFSNQGQNASQNQNESKPSQPQEPSYNEPQFQPQQSPAPSFNEPQQPQFSPSQYDTSMDQFANEMQKRMQQAMMNSAQAAMDSALNAQKMAHELSNEQERLKEKLEQLEKQDTPLQPLSENKEVSQTPGESAFEKEVLPETLSEDISQGNAGSETVSSAQETLSKMLPSITKLLENEDLAKMNANELELFKKLLSFRDFMSEEEKAVFDSGKIRMLLEYIIAKMSGKPGLLKTAISLIKSGLIGVDYENFEAKLESEQIEISNDVIKQVIHTMICLSQELEDKGLATALKTAADLVLEKIEITEEKSQIFC